MPTQGRRERLRSAELSSYTARGSAQRSAEETVDKGQWIVQMKAKGYRQHPKGDHLEESPGDRATSDLFCAIKEYSLMAREIGG